MGRHHERYLAGDYDGKTARQLYDERLGTLDDALALIRDGDTITWSTHGSEPRTFLSHLHTIAPRLEQGVTCWSTISRWEYPVTSDPALGEKFKIQTFFHGPQDP